MFNKAPAYSVEDSFFHIDNLFSQITINWDEGEIEDDQAHNWTPDEDVVGFNIISYSLHQHLKDLQQTKFQLNIQLDLDVIVCFNFIIF